MAIWNKEVVEKEVVNLAEKGLETFGPSLMQGIATAGTQTGPKSQGLVALVVQAVTEHVIANGSAPDLALLKTSIGQLIEGTVGVLQATGKITPGNAQAVTMLAKEAAKQASSNPGNPAQSTPLPKPPSMG